MEPERPARAASALLLSFLLLALATIPQVAWADAPELIVRLTGGERAVYSVEEIERIGFEGDGTLVVVTAGGSDFYPTESITRIEFLWDTSASEDPESAGALIDAIHLLQNQPNPFSPETRIRFELPQGGEVELGIYSPDGRLVRTLVTGQRAAGRHTVRWDGLDDAQRKVSGGVYFYNLAAPGIEESRRMILLP